ncbi:hypothetical protein ACWD4V_12770 [Streptomyces tsukubensis]|uniref:hypothetical protein n=1 Tax=Streptomyces tsukubensis TaxID=83656 RepID=UPI0036948C3B
MSLTLRSRWAATLATAALTALGVAAPGAAAQPQSAKSMVVQWANADPAAHPSIFGTLTIGGIYTCTEPAGTTVPVSFSALQLMPIAMPSGAGRLPCGPGVVDAPWSLTSFPTTDVHYGYVSVLTTFDGVLLPVGEFTV